MKMWIARNEAGYLHLFDEEPTYGCNTLDDGEWYSRGRKFALGKENFPEVTFENSPMEVELINKKEFDSLLEVKEKYEDFLGIVAEMRCLQKEQDKWDDTYYCKSLHKRMVGLQKEVDQWSDLN